MVGPYAAAKLVCPEVTNPGKTSVNGSFKRARTGARSILLSCDTSRVDMAPGGSGLVSMKWRHHPG